MTIPFVICPRPEKFVHNFSIGSLRLAIALRVITGSSFPSYARLPHEFPKFSQKLIASIRPDPSRVAESPEKNLGTTHSRQGFSIGQWIGLHKPIHCFSEHDAVTISFRSRREVDDEID
jgi:hypothetical protein